MARSLADVAEELRITQRDASVAEQLAVATLVARSELPWWAIKRRWVLGGELQELELEADKLFKRVIDLQFERTRIVMAGAG